MRDPDWSLGRYVSTEIRYAEEAEGGDAKAKGMKKSGGKKKKVRKSKFHPEEDDEVEEAASEEEEKEEEAAAATGRRIDQIIDRFEGCVYVRLDCVSICIRTVSTSFNPDSVMATHQHPQTEASAAMRQWKGGARRCASSAALTRTCSLWTSKR